MYTHIVRAAWEWKQDTGIVAVNLQWLRDCVTHATYLEPLDYAVPEPLVAPVPPPLPPPPPTVAPLPTPLPPRALQPSLDGLFLAHARVAMVGCSDTLFCELRRMLCEGGATRHATLEPPVTHIVVRAAVSRVIRLCRSLLQHRAALCSTPQLHAQHRVFVPHKNCGQVGPMVTKEEHAQLREHCSAHPCALLVRPDWLHACMAAAAQLDGQDYPATMATQVPHRYREGRPFIPVHRHTRLRLSARWLQWGMTTGAWTLGAAPGTV